MQPLLNGILRSYQKILSQSEGADIPQDILMPSISQSEFEKLCLIATNHFSNQDIVIDVQSDIYVVGDLHGNIHDLLRILSNVGDIAKGRIIFLGDFVDRGHFSIEVVTLLFTLAITFPDNYFLIRGNHEFRKINENYGFKQQVIEVYDTQSPWEKVNQVFDFLPLAAVIDNAIFCVHGGISPKLKSLADIRNYQRPVFTYEDSLIFDLMWADPTKNTGTFVPSVRGSGNQFGNIALFNFLNTNNLKKMMRGHQCVFNGIERLFENKLTTIFSSSNYGENPKGRAGYIYVNNDLVDKDFQLMPYELAFDRDHTHFVPVITNKPEVTNLTKVHTLLANGLPRVGSKISRNGSRLRLSLNQPQFYQPVVKHTFISGRPRPSSISLS